jgi:hypothetical protein
MMIYCVLRDQQKKKCSSGLTDASSGLVQVVVDNFDADISLHYGKSSTHSLAVLVTQPESEGQEAERDLIPRLSKETMLEQIEQDIIIQRYNGPKKPPIPDNAAAKAV